MGDKVPSSITTIKNLRKTAQRILRAVKNKERIIIYGDADLDGVSSAIILKETLNNLGGRVAAIYFPNREKEGYGINKKALGFLKKLSPALFLSVDCGISNFEEVILARKIGFEVIIIDHHEVLDRLPEASIVVDPKQKDDRYPFKGLATTGIIYKLSKLLLKEKLSDSLKKNFLELVALATLADLMPKETENELMIQEGLVSIEKSWRPGIKVFFEMEELKDAGSSRTIVQKIISTLNITEVKNHSNQAYSLLSASSKEKARALVAGLLNKLYLRQEMIKEMTAEIIDRISKKERLSEKDEPIIYEESPSWRLILTGSVASRICQKYKKPTFIIKKGERESRGAVRTPSGIDSVKAMKHCSRFLKTFGGHPPAAGFTIKNENLEKFKECLIEYFSIPRGSA